MSYRKKLIEVSLPLDAINDESIRRKQKAPKGFPTSLHKYWAQRPVAACRAVLLSQLIDDPSEWPNEFPSSAEQNAERDRLSGLIANAVAWDASEATLHAARFEVCRSLARGVGQQIPAEWRSPEHIAEVLKFLSENGPTVVDPFCGSGSIPLEAQRLGLRASGSDLNPVAVLISKAIAELPSKFAGLAPVNLDADLMKSWKRAEGLADDIRFYAAWIRERAVKQIGDLYPCSALESGAKATTIAWIWTRTVASPDPRMKGAHVPLASTFVLSTKKDREVIVVPILDRANSSWRFEIKHKPTAQEIASAKSGTKTGRSANFLCLLSGSAISEQYVKEQAKAGNLGMRLMAVVAEGSPGRVYLSPTAEQEAFALQLEKPEDDQIDQPLPNNPRWFSPPEYGMTKFRDLFTARQFTALKLLSDLIADAREAVLTDALARWSSENNRDDQRSLEAGGNGPTAYADAVAIYLALVVDRMVFYGSSLCGWLSKDNAMGKSMPQQALAMTWDFAEGNPFGTSSSDILTCARNIADCVAVAPALPGTTIASARAQDRRPNQNDLISTDPPYYDNVGYAELSDFFFVWLRRSLLQILPELFRRVLTPKSDELVATPYRHGGRDKAEEFFMSGMSEVLRGIAGSESVEPTTIYYAFKQSEATTDGVTSAGWASFLQALVDAGFIIDGTWPVRSESAGRLVAQGVNALASCIVLVCRKRTSDAGSISRVQFLRHLRTELPAALAAIRAAGVPPTDIPQAAFGPGIGMFTRYAAVLNPDGSEVSVRDALKLINQVREELGSEAQGDYDAPTRFAIDWFMAHGNRRGKAGDAILMANALGLGLRDLELSGIFRTEEGQAQIIPRDQLPVSWSPTTDRYPTAWEACQHLIKRLTADDGGIDTAAALYAELGDLAEPAHELARRLYDICEQRSWHAEAQPYNNLIQEWDVIEERALAFAPLPPAQGEMAL